MAELLDKQNSARVNWVQQQVGLVSCVSSSACCAVVQFELYRHMLVRHVYVYVCLCVYLSQALHCDFPQCCAPVSHVEQSALLLWHTVLLWLLLSIIGTYVSVYIRYAAQPVYNW